MGFDVKKYAAAERKTAFDVREASRKSGSRSAGQGFGGFDVRDSYKRENAASAAEQIRLRLNSWADKSSRHLTTYSKDYRNSYIENANDWYDKSLRERAGLIEESKEIEALIGEYKDYLNADLVKEMNSFIQSHRGAYTSINDYTKSISEKYAQFPTLDDYEKWDSGWLSEDATVDLESSQKRKAYYEKNQSRIAELDQQISDLESIVYGSRIVSSGYSPYVSTGDSKENNERLKALKSERDSLVAENNRYENEQKTLDDYYKPETEEFKKNAAYRDYKNITVGDAAGYGVDQGTAWNTLSNGGYWDREGNLRDKDDNVVGKSEDSFSFVMEDKLGAYLNTSTEDRVAIQNELQRFANTDSLTTYQNMIFEAENGAWDQLTEGEINIYYDLYKTQGQEAAYKYLSDMKDVLNKRATQEKQEDIRNSEGWEQFGWNVASIPMNVIGGATAFVDDAINVLSGKDVNPYSKAHLWQNMGQTVREETAKDWDEATGNIAIPWLDFSAGDVHQSLMSAADSVGGALTFGKGYSVLMGMGAASSKAKELYERGATKGQVVTGALLSGAAELVFESIGLDGLLKAAKAKNLRAVVGNALKQAGVEAFEEAGTEIANAINEVLVMGDQSKYGTLDWSDASTFASDVANAALGGFISGAAGGGTMALQGVAQAKQYQSAVKAHGQVISELGDVESLKAHAETLLKDKNTSNAWEIRNQLKKVQKNASAKNVGNLYAAIQESVQQQNRKESVQQLKKEGLSKKQAASVYDAILKMEKDLSKGDSQRSTLAAWEGFVKTMEDLHLDDSTQHAVSLVAMDMVQNPQNASQSRLRDLMNARGFANTVDPKDVETLQNSVNRQINTEGRISSDGTTRIETSGESVQIDQENPIAKIENDTVFLNTDKGVFETADILFANEDELYLYEALSSFDAGTASVIATGYDGTMPALDYVHGMEEGVLLYGKHGFQEVGKDISSDSYFSALSEVDQQTALKLGQGLRDLDTKQKVERVKKAIERAKAEREKSSEAKKNTAEDGGEEKRSFSSEFEQKTYDSFGITKPRDSVHVQKQVLKTLVQEGFFKDSENRRTVVVNKDSGMEIEINRSGIEETFSHKHYGMRSGFIRVAKLATIRNIGEAIEKGTMVKDQVSDEHGSKNPNKSFAYIEYQTEIDGTPVVLKMDIKKSPQKNKFWVHSLYVVKSTDGLGENTKGGIASPHLPVGANNSIQQNSGKVKTEGKVFFDDSVELSELTKKQRAEVEYAGNVISAVIGNEIHFFDSRHVSADSREARTNGWYDPSDGSIHLDIAKMESGEKSVLFTLSHELTHFIEDWSFAKYQTFANFLLKNYAEHGVKTDTLVRRKMAELKTTDYDYAMSELVADACERMLLDSNASEKLAELNKTEKGLVQKIKSFLANTLMKIRQAYAQYKGREEAQLLQKMEDKLSEFYALFEDALTDAAQNYRDADGKLDGAEVREQAKKALDKYTEKQYNNFGWASYNEVITAKEREVLLSRFADFKHNRHQYAVTKAGEAVIYSTSCPDVIMYVRGTIRDPEITRIVRLNVDPKEYAIDIAESVIENERRKAPLPLWRIESAFEQGVLQSYDRRDVDSYSEYRRRLAGSSRKADDSSNRTERDRGRSVETLSGIGEDLSDGGEKHQRKLTSTREILANADLNAIDLSNRGGDQLAKHLEDYQAKEKELKKHEDKVRSLSEDILRMRKDREDGKPYDSSKMDALLTERNREQILGNQLRRELQRITKEPSVNNFVQREKLTAWRQNRDEIERGKMERARVTELKRRARKKAETLNTMLTKPTKKLHVKSELQKSVASFLYALNLDTVNYENRIKFLETRLKFAEQEVEAELKRSGITKENAEAFEEQFREKMEKRIQEIQKSKEWNELRQMSMLDKLTDLRKGLKEYLDKEAVTSGQSRNLVYEMLDRNEEFLSLSVEKRLEDLKEKIEAEEDPVERAYLTVRFDMLNEKKGFLPLGAMSLGELQVVDDSLSQVLAMVRDANKVFEDNKTRAAEDASYAAMSEVSEKKKPREIENFAKKGFDKALWNMLQPDTAFHLIGSDTLVRLNDDIVDATHQWGVLVEKSNRFFVKIARKYNWLKWRNDNRLYSFKDTRGRTFQLDIQEIMSLYAYYRRGDQAIDHILNGGVVKLNEFVAVKDKETGEEKKKAVVINHKPKGGTAYKISRTTLESMFKTAFEVHPEAKEYVHEMQSYLSNECAEQGNKTSMLLYGIRLFKEKFYFPLRTWGLQDVFDPDAEGDSMVVNSSFAKPTVKGATRAIVLDRFDTVWAKHTDGMAKYATLSVPMENFTKVWNVRPMDTPVGTDSSIKTVIQARYGSEAIQFVEKFIRDTNGGTRRADKDPLGKALALANKASVIASLSVAIQQPSAIVRAAVYINPKYILKGSLKNVKLGEHNKRWAEVKKYAPVAITKEMGRFDTGVGLETVDWILTPDYENIAEQLVDLLHNPKMIPKASEDLVSRLPSFMDEISWAKLWESCKRQISAEQHLDIDSEKCKVEAGKLFTMVVNRTQVYDSTVVRSQLMRNDSLGAKMLTRFFAEPTTKTNMVIRALVDLNRNGAEGGRFFARTIASICTSNIVNAALAALIYAMRDDDEDENFAEKYLQHFIEKGLDEFNPITHMPLLRDFWSVFEGWSVERPDTEMLSDLIFSTKQWWSDEASIYEKLKDSVQSLSTICGLPLKNLWRDAEGLYKTIRGFSGEYPKLTGQGIVDTAIESLPFTKEKPKSERIYDACVSGDPAQIERYRDNYDTEEKWTAAVSTALKENDPRILQAAIAQLNGNASERVRIQREIIGEGNFSQDLIVTATNGLATSFQSKIRTASEAKKAGRGKEYEKIVKELQKAGYPDELISKYIGDKIKALQEAEEEEAKQGEKDTSWYKSSDIAAAYASGDEKLALEIIDDLVRVKTANSTEEKAEDREKAAKASVKSIVTEYWKPKYKAAYQAKNQAEMRRIRYILKDTGLYGSVDDLVKTCERWTLEK